MNRQHRDSAGFTDRKLKFLTRYKQPVGREVRKDRTEQNRQLYFLPLISMEHFRDFHFVKGMSN